MHGMFHLVEQYGLLVVFLGVLFESLGVPIPAMPLLIVAGAFAATGQLPFATVLLLAMLGCVLGEIPWYFAGRRYGGRVLRSLCRISISPDSCVRQTENFFVRWGAKTLVVAKFIPGLSLIAPPLAGAMRVAIAPFLVYASIGAALFAAAGVGLGAIFHSQIEILTAGLARLGTTAIYVLLSAFLVFLAFKWWDRRRFLAAMRMARISVAELDALRQAGANPVILDVRSQAARQVDAHRIPGARFINLPLAEDALAGLSPQTEVVVYCTCPNEASAARVARLLHDRGFKRVRPLAGGLDAWVAAGLAVELMPGPDYPTASTAPLEEVPRSIEQP